MRKLLGAFSDDAEVVLSKDGEGNSFSPLSDLSRGRYVADTTWCGEFHGSDEGETCCLWPVN
jgi:hypothetical protein